MMSFYGGALTHKEILNMQMNQFYMYFEYMVYMKRCESKEGIAENKKLDATDIATWGYL